MDEIHFYCAICGESLSAQAESAGGFSHCPKCHRLIPVPGYPARPGEAEYRPVFSPLILEIALKYFCQSCWTKLWVDVRYQGQTFECPVCRAQTTVPEWNKKAPLGAEETAGTTAPLVFLTADEREFLSAPLENHGAALLPASTR
jgi:DNA-directed RNA polymerase subunit RPC12/RpoP